jgi:hypothetical protein
MTHYLLVLYSLTPRLQSYNAITLSLIITLQQKELKLIPLFLLLLLLLLLFPPLPFSSLPCLLLPKPQLHISSFHGLYEKKKKNPKLTPSFSISLSLLSSKTLSQKKKKKSDNGRAAASSSSSSSSSESVLQLLLLSGDTNGSFFLFFSFFPLYIYIFYNY